MGPAPIDAPGLPPKQRKVKAYKVLGDVGEFKERLAATLPPPKPPPPTDVFSVQDTSEFPPDVWFAATISPDNGVAFIASYRELCKARALYQQQLTNIHTARKQHGMATTTAAGALLLPTQLPPASFPGEPHVNRTIAETLRMSAEARVLGKFEVQQARWDGVTATLATRVGRPPQDLAMQRGPAWRTRAELTELLYRAQPRDARGLNPDEAFLTSLRDSWERVIPLGSIFSGLALHIKEKPHQLPDTRAARVGRPLDPLCLGLGARTLKLATQSQPGQQPGQQQQQRQQEPGMQSGAAAAAPAFLSASGLNRPPMGRSLSARGRAWEDGEVLRQRVVEYGSRLRSLAPHDPDFGSLVVAGEALEGQLEALATAPVTLTEVEAHVREHNLAAYQAYQAVKDEMEAQLRAALEAEAAQREAAEAAARALAPQPGPHLTASVSRLSLACHVGETAYGSVTLTSSGTAAVWWRWERRPGAQPAHSATDAGQPGRFVASQQSGVLLPGQSLELTITFVAGAAGTFRESWELVTTPPLQGSTGPTLTLHLRGAAELRDQTSTGRSEIESRLAQKEKMAKVAAALERVLRDVRLPRRPLPSEPPEEAAAADAWDRTNGCSVVDGGGPYTWPPLFYSPSIQSELSEVYREANAALTQALTPPVEEDTKKKRPGASARHRKTVEEAPPPPPKYPRTWEGPSLATLDSLLAELSTAAPAAAAPLVARAEAAKARARVPPSSRRLLRRAMRSLVGKMVDGVGERLDALRADLEAKEAAEAEAAAAAAAAADGAASGSADGGGASYSIDAEGSNTSVPGKASSGGAGKAAAGKAKGAAAGGKGGKGARSPSPSPADVGGAAGATGASGAGGSGGSLSLEHLQPIFHEKALTGTRAVIKASLNSLMDEVLRHKVAVGDALEARIRDIDGRIGAEAAALGATADATAAPAAAAVAGTEGGGEGGEVDGMGVGGAVEWFAPPAGGVPAPRPGAAAPVRSAALERLYWERLGELRTWTSLGVPNRGDIR